MKKWSMCPKLPALKVSVCCSNINASGFWGYRVQEWNGDEYFWYYNNFAHSAG